jgi:BASS family bile acid:Na+ symporter
MPLLSMAGIGIIIVIIVATGRDSLLKVGALLILVMFILNVSGYTFGYWLSRLLSFKEKECRTIALEVGMQNSGLASGLALLMGGINTIGLAPAVFGPVMNISGSSLATWWHARAPNQTATTTASANTTFLQN